VGHDQGGWLVAEIDIGSARGFPAYLVSVRQSDDMLEVRGSGCRDIAAKDRRRQEDERGEPVCFGFHAQSAILFITRKRIHLVQAAEKLSPLDGKVEGHQEMPKFMGDREALPLVGAWRSNALRRQNDRRKTIN
jgi:hypothetical protein